VGVSLSKGGNVSLTKEAPGLRAVTVGLGWDVRTSTGADFDLDASAIMLAGTGKVASDAHFVFFNNLQSPDGSVEQCRAARRRSPARQPETSSLGRCGTWPKFCPRVSAS